MFLIERQLRIFAIINQSLLRDADLKHRCVRHNQPGAGTVHAAWLKQAA